MERNEQMLGMRNEKKRDEEDDEGSNLGQVLFFLLAIALGEW